MAGDVVRRLMVRTMAQQRSDVVEAATAPYQYALELAQSALRTQLLTEENPRATVLSADGIGAFDLISRKSMLEVLMRVEGGPSIMPCVSMFYGQPLSGLWESDNGTVHTIEQGEGGEQDDPLMPLLFALGQHAALSAIDNSLGADDRLMAFLDDAHSVTLPEGLGNCYGSVQQELWAHSRIRIHEGKTKVWNSGGDREFCDELERISQATDFEGRVWKDRRRQPENRASECWGLHWGTLVSWKPLCACASRTTNFCWTAPQQCPICSRHGLSFFIVPQPLPLICCVLSDLTWFEGLLKGSMRDCGGFWAQICRTRDLELGIGRFVI